MMRAARYHGREDVRVEMIPEPHAGPDEVTVAVAYNGLCGTDLHEYLHGPHHIPVTPHPLTGAQLPIVLGDEFSGTISEFGLGVNDLMPGDRVCVEPIYSCGRCSPCLGRCVAAGGAVVSVDHYRTDGWVEHVDLDDVVTGGLEPMAMGRSKKILVDVGEAA